MQIALLGLGKKGKIIAEMLLAGGHEVVVFSDLKEELDAIRTERAEFVVSQKLTIAHTIDEIQSFLRKPRVFLSLQQDGAATEAALVQIDKLTEPGDLVIDGGNSNFKDTNRHHDEFKSKLVNFLGIGFSGGVHALENGFCIMAGGDQEAYLYVTPILDSLAAPNGVHKYFGLGGAGHFVKMIHNGIESGMVQAIAEGIGVLSKSEFQLSIPDVVDSYQDGGIISSFLLDMVIDAVGKDPGLVQADGKINVSDEARWTVEQAKIANIPTPVIGQSVEFRNRSQYDKATQDNFVAKFIQSLLSEYGADE